MTQTEMEQSIWGRIGKYRIIPVIILGMFLISLIFTYLAFSTPVKSKETVITHKVKYIADFSCFAEARPSVLFPQGEKIKDPKNLFTRIISSIKAKAAIRITSDTPISIEGESRIILRLRADELWSKDFLLMPERKFKFDKITSATVLEEIYSIDVNKFISFIDQVEKETQVLGGNYTLSVIPVVMARTSKSKINLDFSPEYTFNLSKTQITTTSNSLQEQENPIEGTQEKLNRVGVGFLTLPVVFARYLFSCLVIVILTGLIYHRRVFNTVQTEIREDERIKLKYGSRMVFADSGSILGNKDTVIKVGGINDLLKIADEHDKPLICIPEGLETAYAATVYCVMDSNIMYIFEPVRHEG
ncbi:DUF5305 family protein [Phosphitispora fastidiosa]|uniref:DUF5305 family protein n=1 Tax=Phosphitispora fastidiosa TaxID=2837202 RepID=UPI001E3BB920|nr:DUF5305 family protein [Phosphitispora fastidiosa]MBU7006554.1 hypothetical protein [Phosphitispora fastidiosa]